MIVRALPLLWAAVSFAQSPPAPPCGGGTVFPSYAAVDSAPKVEVYEREGLGGTWVPPDCTGWKSPGFAMLVVTAGRFHAPSGAAGLIQRIGAISELKGIRYWSTTHQSWRTLINNSSALESSAGPRRKDFAPDELTPGSTLYFEQEDNLTGKATYRLRVLSISAERMVFETENVTTMRYLFVPVFHPGEIQAVYFLDREPETEDVWRFYNISRTGPGASSLAIGHDASSINRAVALYRHLARIPTDQEPPPAR
jgi:hypothetical protein